MQSSSEAMKYGLLSGSLGTSQNLSCCGSGRNVRTAECGYEGQSGSLTARPMRGIHPLDVFSLRSTGSFRATVFAARNCESGSMSTSVVGSDVIDDEIAY